MSEATMRVPSLMRSSSAPAVVSVPPPPLSSSSSSPHAVRAVPTSRSRAVSRKRRKRLFIGRGRLTKASAGETRGALPRRPARLRPREVEALIVHPRVEGMADNELAGGVARRDGEALVVHPVHPKVALKWPLRRRVDLASGRLNRAVEVPPPHAGARVARDRPLEVAHQNAPRPPFGGRSQVASRPVAAAEPRLALPLEAAAFRGLEGGVLLALRRRALVLALIDLRDDQGSRDPYDREGDRRAERDLRPRRRRHDGVARRRPHVKPRPDPLEDAEPWRLLVGQELSVSPACCSARTSATVFLPRPSGPWTFQRDSGRAGQTSQISTPTTLSRRPAARPGFSP